MTEYEYYMYYRAYYVTYGDHLRAVDYLFETVSRNDPHMSIKDFRDMKIKFLNKYFEESLEKFLINKKG